MVDFKIPRGASGGYLAVFPCCFDRFKFLRTLFRPASQIAAPRPRGGDALCLPLPYEFALGFRDVAKQLQHDVRDQNAGEVAVLPRVQKRHVQNDDGRPLLFRQYPPLV